MHSANSCEVLLCTRTRTVLVTSIDPCRATKRIFLYINKIEPSTWNVSHLWTKNWRQYSTKHPMTSFHSCIFSVSILTKVVMHLVEWSSINTVTTTSCKAVAKATKLCCLERQRGEDTHLFAQKGAMQSFRKSTVLLGIGEVSSTRELDLQYGTNDQDSFSGLRRESHKSTSTRRGG